LGYLPVGNVTVPGKGGAPLALWAGSADVSLAARGQAPLAVRMVSARIPLHGACLGGAAAGCGRCRGAGRARWRR
ncbi:hypothetical protein, partial [Bordetella pertussis]|uniref:hypothetical protein n=1 Tax=Bordetella pertussis TaxID=520 RepID=UPI0021CB20E9